MSDPRLETGRCLCAAVCFEAEGEPLWVAHCHCESCRRSTGAPVTTFVGYRRQQLRYTSGKRRFYESSPGVKRGFCVRCGTPLTYESDRAQGEIHLYVSTLDHPERFPPQSHVFYTEGVAWLELLDELPRFEQTGRGAKPFTYGPARKHPGARGDS